MKQSKTSVAMLVFAVLSVAVLAVSPASAHRANAEAAATTTTSASQTTSGATGDTTSGGDTTETADTSTDSSENTPEVRQHVANKIAALHSQAQARVAEMRQGKHQLTAAQLDKICQNRQVAINNKVKAFGNAADAHLTRLNDVFTKIQAYQTAQKLNVANYQALVTDATAKQQAATDAVAALKTAGANVTCTSTDPASNLMIVQTAASNARDALKAYRTSLKNMVVALAQAQPASQTDNTTTSTGGTN